MTARGRGNRNKAQHAATGAAGDVGPALRANASELTPPHFALAEHAQPLRAWSLRGKKGMAARERVRGEQEGHSPRHAKVIAPSLPQRLLSPQDAARYLGLGSRWAVRRLVVSGDLPVVRIAGKWRLDVEDLDRLIAAKKSGSDEARPTGAGLVVARERPPKFSRHARLAPAVQQRVSLVTER